MAAISWKSAVSGSWTLGSNWDSGTVPAIGDDVTIGVAGTYTITLNASISINSLTISDAAAALVIASGATESIAGNLSNSGTLDVDVFGGDGGSTLTIGGVFSNTGSATIGVTNLSAATTVTAGGLVNTGVLILQGNASSGTSNQATLNITGAGPSTISGFVGIRGDADLELTGGVTSIAGGSELTLEGSGARVSLGAATSSTALSGLATNSGTLLLRGGSGNGLGGAALAIATGFSNSGTLDVDIFGGDGGSTLTIGGVFSNTGSATIGVTNLSAATTVTAGGLVNTGVLILQGNASSGTSNQATLNITGAGPSTISGFVGIRGDADLELTGGVTSIAGGSELTLEGSGARVSLGAATSSTALAGLATNSGTLLLRGGSGNGLGGAALAIATGFGNIGTLDVDVFGGDGGSTLAIGGTFSNTGSATIGVTNLSAATTVTAGGLVNTGALILQGNASSGTSSQATLSVTGAGPATISGFVGIRGDADLELTGGVTAIAGGSELTLEGSGARVSLGADTSSTALSGLATNSGTLLLRGGSGNGLGGAALAIATGFSNIGTLDVDVFGGDGGSTLAIGGTFSNTGSATIGVTNLSAATTVTAGGLVNTGALILQGNASSGTSSQATLSVTGAGPATISGFVGIRGDADLELTGGVTAIAGGSELTLEGSGARVSLGADTSSTALSGLATNSGTLLLRGGSGNGLGGAALAIATGFSNIGTLDVDVFGGDGGSTLAIGGTFSNTGSATIGVTNLSAATTVTAGGLVNTGALILQGNASSGTSSQATLSVTGAGPATISGFVGIRGDADLELTGGVTAIAGGSELTLEGSGARVSLGADTSSTALSGLATNSGTLLLRGGSGNGLGGAALAIATGFSNIGTLDVDVFGGDGGSTLAIGGTFSNTGSATIGVTNLSAATTVTAGGLVNTGLITSTSNLGGPQATLSLTGPGTPGVAAGFNTGTIASNANGIAVSGGARLVNGSSGSAAGLISAGYDGVLLSNSGTLVNFGTVSGANGTAVAFGSGGGTVVIEPGAVFTGVLGGLAKGDFIDFAHVVATGFTLVNSTLTLFNQGAVVPGATVAVTGSFTGTDLALVSDGNGGVEVGMAPLGPVIVGTYYTPILLSNPAINNSATVTATGRVAPSYGDAIIGAAGVPGTVSNLGTIAAASPSSVGISLGDGGLIANGTVGFAGGYISGSLAGVKIGSGSATITNAGTITGGSGILIAAGSLATIGNAGTIAGIGGTAVSLAGGSNRLILAPGALFQGKADGGGGNSVVEIAPSLVGLGMAGGPTGAADTAAAVYVSLGSVSNFSALQVDPGAATDADGNLSFETLVNQGQINLLAGDSLVVGTVAGAAAGGTIDLKSGGSVHFTGAVAAGQTVLFRPPGGSVAIDQPGQFAAAITQFAATDLIDLPLGTASFQQYAGGVLSLSYNGKAVALQLSTTAVTPQFQFTPDGHGGTDILVSDVCFCRGTLILAERGEVAVEDLAVGERVRTLAGALKPIRWIGTGSAPLGRGNRLARPVIVRRGALAEGVPSRDLHLTHGHALYLEGVLIPVENLVNHHSILWDESALRVEYYHIELADHDVLLANGAPAESYYDADNRAQFDNTRPGSAPGEAIPGFAPVLSGGEIVERVWAALLARAGGRPPSGSQGETTDDPDLHLLVNDLRLDPPAIDGTAYRFALPGPPVAPLRLRSRSGVPSLLGITAHDHRRLGVAISRIVYGQRGVTTTLLHNVPLLQQGGCHPPEAAFSWTDGDLELPARLFAHMRGPFTLTVHTERPGGMRYPLEGEASQAA